MIREIMGVGLLQTKLPMGHLPGCGVSPARVWPATARPGAASQQPPIQICPLLGFPRRLHSPRL